jgi:multiple sugar transport system substrate-binding protein
MQKMRPAFTLSPCGTRFRQLFSRRSFFCVVMSVLVSTLMFSGCKSQSSLPIQPIKTIIFSTWGNAEELTTLKSLVAKFEETHSNIHVELMHIPDNYYQKLHILIAADMTPDVMFTNSIYFPVYAHHGVFKNLSPFLEHSQVLSRKNFYTNALQTFQLPVINSTSSEKARSGLGAIPRDISNLVVFYNKTLFKKAGLPLPSSHWTWQECLVAAKALTKRSNTSKIPSQFGFSFYKTPPLLWLPFVWSWGGTVFKDSTFAMNSPHALAGLAFYQHLRFGASVAPTPQEVGSTSMTQLFIQQRLAMMVNGRWVVPLLRKEAAFDWDVVPFPAGPSGSHVGIDSSGYAMAAQSKHPKEAWQLIEFLSSRAAQEAVTRSGLIIPARRDVAESSLFLSRTEKPVHGQVFLEAIDTGIPTQSHPRWNELSEELNLALEPVWDGKQSANAAMKKVQPVINTLLAETAMP